MARGSRAAIATERNDEQLYSEPINPFQSSTDGSTDSGGSDTDSGGSTSDNGGSEYAPYGYLPNGQPRKRRARKQSTRTETFGDSPEIPSHSRAQIRGLSKSIGLSSKAAFNAIAGFRTMTLGYLPNPETGQPLIKPDGTPLGAGEVWLISDKEARELGDAWAEVIALYAPPELVERGAVLSTAIVTTGMILATRVFADIQTQTMQKQVQMMMQEGLLRTPPNMQAPHPNGSYTGMDFSQVSTEQSAAE